MARWRQRPPDPTDETESSSSWQDHFLCLRLRPPLLTIDLPTDPGLLTWLEGRHTLTTAEKRRLPFVNWSRSCTAARRWLFPKVVSQPDDGKHDREVAKRVNGLTWRASERARLARLIYHCLVWPPSGRLIAIGANIIIFPEFPRPITDFASSRATLVLLCVGDRGNLRKPIGSLFA